MLCLLPLCEPSSSAGGRDEDFQAPDSSGITFSRVLALTIFVSPTSGRWDLFYLTAIASCEGVIVYNLTALYYSKEMLPFSFIFRPFPVLWGRFHGSPVLTT
jgi:hypothetical protein